MKIITPPKNAFYITITDYYLRICNGNECAAALLRLYEHRHAQIITDAQNSGRKITNIAELQQDCGNAYLQKCLLGVFSHCTIRKANVLLSELGFVQLYENYDAENENRCLPNSIIFMPKNVQNAIDLPPIKTVRGTIKIEGGVLQKKRGGAIKIETELIELQSIEKERESENSFDFKNEQIPTLEQVQNYAIKTNQDPQKATEFYTTQTANNWLHNGKPINNWQSFFDGYKKRVFNGSVRNETPAKPTVPSIPKGEYF
jgi:hypothetical protein